jgi:flagellar hook-associated protein 1 FlgK
MGSLTTSLGIAAESMRALQKAIEITSNNVLNAKTPGYVKQSQALLARRLELDGGLGGGLEAGAVVSYRANHLEVAVRDSAQRHGYFAQQAQTLSKLEPIFDISGKTGIGAAIDKLFEGFSLLSVSPNDIPVRQDVLERARNVAAAFQSAGDGLAASAADADRRLRALVQAVNRAGEAIVDYNQNVLRDIRVASDPGMDAQVHQQLEELAQYVDFDVLRREDGALQVNLGRQTPLVIGAHFLPLSVDDLGVVRDASGGDLSAVVTGGQIRGLLDFRDQLLPELRNDLNRLAEGLANAVNTTLAAGLDRDGNPPVVGLFTYDAGKLEVTPGFTPEQIAAAAAGAPGGNGNSLELAALGTAKTIDSLTFSQFYGFLAAKAGRWLSEAKAQEQTQSLLVTQARSVRAEASGVSLDEEAANLIAFQRGYQATAELIRVLNSLTETTINIIR